MADRTVTYLYDLAGRLKSLEYPSGLTLSYDHDDLGRVTAVDDGTDDRVADTYTGYLLQRREYANGTYLTYVDDQGEDLDGYGYRCLCQVDFRVRADCALSLASLS